MEDNHTTTRREAIAAVATGVLSLAVAPAALAQTEPEHKRDTRTFLHQERVFGVIPARIYHVLLDSKEFSAMTGMPATISRQEGGAFKTFGGIVNGRNIELTKDKRIVQAWRPASFPPSVYSVVKFDLVPNGTKETWLILDHTGFPEGHYESLNSGWDERYWEPMKKYLR